MAYTIQSQILETIYGGLYKGCDTKTGSIVAIKLSNASTGVRKGEDPLGEIEILSKLQSQPQHDGGKYVIQLYDTFLTEFSGISFYCSVMEYAPNGDLLDKITNMKSQGRQLSFSNCRRYLSMLAKGLSFIHQQGISHLDISLENILVTKKDELRLCDFGQAEASRLMSPIDTDIRKGKAKYMCPEVFNAQAYDGFKADIWSLGICLWGMVTGGLIYRTASVDDCRFQLLTKGKKGILRLLHLDGVDDVPPLLVHLLSKMLKVDAEKRYLIEDVLAHPWLKVQKTKERVQKPLETSPESELSDCEKSSPETREDEKKFFPSPSSTKTLSPALSPARSMSLRGSRGSPAPSLQDSPIAPGKAFPSPFGSLRHLMSKSPKTRSPLSDKKKPRSLTKL